MLHNDSPARVHPSSVVSVDAHLGAGTQVWLNCQVRERARIGAECILGKGVYVDADVTIGSRVKIQNYVSVFRGVTIEDGVFVGPHACFNNDLRPRAINVDGSLKGASDWTVSKTLVCYGASIGANATVLSGLRIGRWSMVGAGSVVTRSVPDFGLVVGNPATVVGFVCSCGAKIHDPFHLECECLAADDRDRLRELWEKYPPR